MLGRLARWGLGAALSGVLVLAPAPASADGTRLCRAFTSLLLAPTDVALAPLISARDLREGLTTSDDPRAAKLLFSGPGYAWLLTLQLYGAATRMVQGVWDVGPGIAQLAGDAPAPPPRYVAAAQGRALYAANPGPCPIQLGLSHLERIR